MPQEDHDSASSLAITLARRLHDGPVQQLTAAQFFLEAGLESARRHPGHSAADERHFADAVSAICDASADLRAIIEELRVSRGT